MIKNPFDSKHIFCHLKGKMALTAIGDLVACPTLQSKHLLLQHPNQPARWTEAFHIFFFSAKQTQPKVRELWPCPHFVPSNRVCQHESSWEASNSDSQASACTLEHALLVHCLSRAGCGFCSLETKPWLEGSLALSQLLLWLVRSDDKEQSKSGFFVWFAEVKYQ